MSEHICNYSETSIQPYILVAGVDPGTTNVINSNLVDIGCKVECCNSGEDVMPHIQYHVPDMLLLDYQLSGLNLCDQIRKNKNNYSGVPIIMINSKNDINVRVQSFKAGADDSIVKPFDPLDLEMKIQAILRRIRPAFSDQILRFQDIEMDNSTRKVFRNKKIITLKPIEYRLLQSFMEFPNRVFSREQLIEKAWKFPDHDVDYRTVDVHINTLRKLLNADGKLRNYIKTVHSFGYTMEK